MDVVKGDLEISNLRRKKDDTYMVVVASTKKGFILTAQTVSLATRKPG
jgi:hypothetical protein